MAVTGMTSTPHAGDIAMPLVGPIVRLWHAADEDEARPLYVRLREILRTGIENGSFALGDRLPSEGEIAAALGISRITVRHALADLVSEGYIKRGSGRRTVVLRSAVQDDRSQRLGSLAESLRAAGFRVDVSTLLISRIRPSEPARLALRISPEESQAPILRIERLVKANGIAVATTTMELAVGPEVQLDPDVLENQDSVIPVLGTLFGIRATHADKVIRADLSNSEDRRLLATESCAAILVAEVTIFAEDRRLAFAVTRYRGDEYKYRLFLKV
jgi:GntR family transcriptional regulator